jgi:hypothetical protein
MSEVAMILGLDGTSGLGHLQPLCAVGGDGSLSRDSFRGPSC